MAEDGIERDALQRVHQQSRVHEFVGKKLVVLVVELRAAFYGAGGGVDLVVDGDQLAAADSSFARCDRTHPPQASHVAAAGLPPGRGCLPEW